MAQSDSSKTYVSGSWVFHLPGPVCSRRRSGGLPVLVHTVCWRAWTLRLRRAQRPLAI